MSCHTTAQTQQTSIAPTLISDVLQRACTCGQHTLGSGECEGCNKKQLQRGAVSQAEPVEVPSIVNDVLGSAGQPLDHQTRAAMEPRFAQDFSQITIATGTDFFDGPVEEEEESVNLPLPPARQAPTPVQPVPLCPVTSRVDDITDLTPTGLQAGFLSAYGIIARMRVLPDRTTWDGRQVTESLTQTFSTCPTGLTRPGPCNGSSTFTVGAASGGSGVIPQQPAVRNRFYDFHTSHSRGISFLHDPGRNPAGMNACEAVCRQEYSCNNTVIGTHIITRRFRKGSFNGRNVTIIDVSKVDNPAGPGDFPMRTLPLGQEYASLTAEPGEIA